MEPNKERYVAIVVGYKWESFLLNPKLLSIVSSIHHPLFYKLLLELNGKQRNDGKYVLSSGRVSCCHCSSTISKRGCVLWTKEKVESYIIIKHNRIDLNWKLRLV